jgi:hypothetical protein
MAKLSTPAHECAVRYVDGHGAPTGHGCPFPAYRREPVTGEWKCRRHRRDEAAQRAASQAAWRAANPFPEPAPVGQDWRDMPPRTFDREAKPQPLALFPEPDRSGTPDMFDTTETEEHTP